jgi:hypothetical protein
MFSTSVIRTRVTCIAREVAAALAALLVVQPTSPVKAATAVAIQIINMCCVMADLPAAKNYCVVRTGAADPFCDIDRIRPKP